MEKAGARRFPHSMFDVSQFIKRVSMRPSKPLPQLSPLRTPHSALRTSEGSVLIVVLWIVFGLIAVTLYFAHTMSFELRASDNRVAGLEAEQAIEGARRYFSCLLSNVNQPGVLPDGGTYLNEAVPIGNAHFWVIGRPLQQDSTTVTTAHFGLIDESSKFNLNSVSSNILINLPRMTPELVANILAWRSTNTSSLSGGAESDTYMNVQPPYLCKNSPFETVDELRLIYNMDMDTLYGEDANLNGILDPNENDGDALAPTDNMDGQLDPGLFEYVTVYSREPSTYTSTNSAGTVTNQTRFNITTTNGISGLRSNLVTLFGQTRAQQMLPSNRSAAFTSPLQFFISQQVTQAEIPLIEASIRGSNIVGLINVNTASQTVLACIPGLDTGQAATLVSYRQSNTNNLNGSIAWVTQALDSTSASLAGPYLTGRGYQFTADVAALGHNGRGYRRVQFVYDTSQGAPVILYRRDLSSLGWALGKEVRDKWLLAKSTP
ncbi:MAG: ral secretion pathway protein [Pedosphaera sp.]|nr:ral secretion pathway protein [Pedosphaera sp.]